MQLTVKWKKNQKMHQGNPRMREKGRFVLCYKYINKVASYKRLVKSTAAQDVCEIVATTFIPAILNWKWNEPNCIISME